MFKEKGGDERPEAQRGGVYEEKRKKVVFSAAVDARKGFGKGYERARTAIDRGGSLKDLFEAGLAKVLEEGL